MDQLLNRLNRQQMRVFSFHKNALQIGITHPTTKVPILILNQVPMPNCAIL